MTKEQELLLEAKRRYPVGSNVKSLYRGDLYYGLILNHDCGVKPTDREIWVSGANLINYQIYSEGKWAEIISKPNLNNYYFY